MIFEWISRCFLQGDASIVRKKRWERRQKATSRFKVFNRNEYIIQTQQPKQSKSISNFYKGNKSLIYFCVILFFFVLLYFLLPQQNKMNNEVLPITLESVATIQSASANQNAIRLIMKNADTTYFLYILPADIKEGKKVQTSGKEYDYPIWGIIEAFNRNNIENGFTISAHHPTNASIEILKVNYNDNYIKLRFSCELVGGEDLKEYHKYSSPDVRISGEYFDKMVSYTRSL